jgi:hypothetical protein
MEWQESKSGDRATTRDRPYYATARPLALVHDSEAETFFLVGHGHTGFEIAGQEGQRIADSKEKECS